VTVAYNLRYIPDTVHVGGSTSALRASLIGFVIAQMSTRPTISSVLPRLVRNPIKWSAANPVTGTVETLGLVLAPN